MKRLPSVFKQLPTCLFGVCCLLFANTTLAQTYQPGIQLDDSLVVFVKKCSFPQAGEKLVTVSTQEDTSAKTQMLTVRLYNDDLSLYRVFGTTRPLTDWIMYMHNGFDVVEHVEQDEPVYYWMVTSVSDLDTTYTNYTTVFDESNNPLLTFPVSFHGHQTFIADGKLKVAGEAVTWDTVHYTNEMGSGWYTMQVLTTSIFDVATKTKEATFPKGTYLHNVLTVNDTLMMLTRNLNMELYQNGHPLGSKATCMNMTVYGADYQPLKTLSFDIDLFGAPNKDAINYVTSWEPLFDGQRLFFSHQMNYYIKDEQNMILDNRDRVFLTDANGNPLAHADNGVYNPSEALWLPNQHQTVFLNYNGLVMNATLDSLFVCSKTMVSDRDSVYFFLQDEAGAHVYDETFARMMTLDIPEGNWSLNSTSQYRVNSDSLFELVFYDWEKGVYIINEKGHVLANTADLQVLWDGTENGPLLIRGKNRLYANILDDSNTLWQHTAPLTVKVVNGETTLPLAVQLFEIINGGPVLVDASEATGLFEKVLPEGTYVLRTQPKDLYPGTYFPSGLLWEDAQPLTFTTDSAVSVEIEQIPALPTLSSQDLGVVSGTFLEVDAPTAKANAPASLRGAVPYVPFEHTHIYLKRVDNQALIAVTAVNVNTYRMEHLPSGQYQVLVDMPGKPLLDTATVQLTEGNKDIQLNFAVAVDGISIAYNSAIQPLRSVEFSVYPNPAVDHIQIDTRWEGCRLDACDLSGRLLLSTTVTNNRVDVGKMAPGLYLLHLHTLEGTFTTRLIKY
ncbi:MAG: hypothetical protein BWY72_00745 [Bacteroidetes bacterium ADurb.Bin416]|jgi:hypothetical protein|nr:MAG: hypothetical protein BWY72_00745 [Bacteroidetes bacterium ADurb.Bin416]